MSESANYFAIITADVRYDKNLSASEKLFFAEITSLTLMNRKCYASNSYFANLYGVSRSTISLWVSNLAKRGYIDVQYEYNGKEIEKRFISIVNPSGIHIFEGGQKSEQVVRKSEGGGQKIGGGWSENQKENNTLTESNNTPTESNTIGRVKKTSFEAPSVEDVYAIMGNRRESEMFVSYYESKGWVVGKSKMKDWKAAVRGWMVRKDIKPKRDVELYGDSI